MKDLRADQSPDLNRIAYPETLEPSLEWTSSIQPAPLQWVNKVLRRPTMPLYEDKMNSGGWQGVNQVMVAWIHKRSQNQGLNQTLLWQQPWQWKHQAKMAAEKTQNRTQINVQLLKNLAKMRAGPNLRRSNTLWTSWLKCKILRKQIASIGSILFEGIFVSGLRDILKSLRDKRILRMITRGNRQSNKVNSKISISYNKIFKRLTVNKLSASKIKGRSAEGDADKSIILESNQGHLSKVLHRRNQPQNHPNQDQRNLLFHIIQNHKAIRARFWVGSAKDNEAFQVQNIWKAERNKRI